MIGREQELRQVRADAHERIKRRQEAEKEEKKAAAEIDAFKQRTKLEAAQLQLKLLQARDRKAEDTGQPQRTFYCPMCKMPGVKRGRECPNRHNYPGYVPRP